MNAAPAICRVAFSGPPDAARRARTGAICASANAAIDRFDPALIPVHLSGRNLGRINRFWLNSSAKILSICGFAPYRYNARQ
jgi:hypothetical protein